MMWQAIEARQQETRILVVDDSEPMRRSLRMLLEGQDHWKVCDEASNGQEAVTKFSKEKFDVVVLDFQMPVMDGLEAARQIIVRSPDTPILMVSMHASRQLAKEARKAGIRGVCGKADIKCVVEGIEALLLKNRTSTTRSRRAPLPDDPLTNSQLSELLANAGDDAKPPLSKAYRRASRRALLWPEEASSLYQAGRSLTELPGVGPYLEKAIGKWIESSPAVGSPPDIRENFLTRTQVRTILEKQPSWASRARGDLQMHTEWSDGSASIQEMAEAADARGYEYIAITDHSKGLKIAGGINEEQLRQQAEQIAAVNESLGAVGKTLRVLRSIEVNLNPAGQVDMEVSSLGELDIVLGCFHSSLRKKDDQTDRYVAALRNPAIQILGHPRGRIYNFRLGLSADWSRVFAVAAELDKAVEIDSYPDRQDMSIDLIRLAGKAGCRISIGTDSHGPSQLEFIEFGLAAALKAKINPDRILNFMSRAKLMEWAAGQRDRDSGRLAS